MIAFRFTDEEREELKKVIGANSRLQEFFSYIEKEISTLLTLEKESVPVSDETKKQLKKLEEKATKLRALMTSINEGAQKEFSKNSHMMNRPLPSKYYRVPDGASDLEIQKQITIIKKYGFYKSWLDLNHLIDAARGPFPKRGPGQPPNEWRIFLVWFVTHGYQKFLNKTIPGQLKENSDLDKLIDICIGAVGWGAKFPNRKEYFAKATTHLQEAATVPNDINRLLSIPWK